MAIIMKCSPAPEQHSQPSRTSVFHTEFLNFTVMGLLTLHRSLNLEVHMVAHSHGFRQAGRSHMELNFCSSCSPFILQFSPMQGTKQKVPLCKPTLGTTYPCPVDFTEYYFDFGKIGKIKMQCET
jgi:hypothetical protein